MSRPESPAPQEPAPSPPPDATGGAWRAPASPWNASLLAALFAVLIVSGFALYLILQVRAAERMIAVETGISQTPGVLRLQAPGRRWPTDFTQEVLEDPAGTLTIADVLSPAYRDDFAPWPNGALRTRFTSSALWVRLQVRNVSVLPDDFLLQYDRANTDSVTLFRSMDDGPFVRVETGALLPFAAREVAHPEFIFPLSLAPRQKADLYLRVQSGSLLATSLTLWTESGFATYDGLRRFVWGAYYGVLLAIAFFHFFLYLSLRERPYLWLVVWIIGIIFLFSTVDGRAHRFFWPQGGTATSWGTPVAMAWVLAGMIAFTSTFLQTAQRAPVLHRVMNGLMVLVGLSLLLTPFVSKAALSLFQYALLLPIVATAMLAAWAALRDGFKPALIFLVAMLLPLVLGIYDLAMVFLGSTQRQISREGEGLIAVLFITVLTLALDDRINDLRRDREGTLRDLRHSERRLEQYMDAMPMAIDVRNTDGVLTFWNSSVMAEMSTRGNPDFMSLREVNRHLFVRAGTHDPYPWEALPFVRAVQGETSYADDIEVRLGDAATPIEVWSSPIKGETGDVEQVITAVNDISSRRRAQAEIDGLRLLYQSIVQDQSALICRFQPDGEILFANEAFAHYFTGATALPPQTRLDQVVTDSAYLSTLAALLAGLSPGNPVSTGVAQYSGKQFGATEFGEPQFGGADVGGTLSNPRWLQWSIRAIHDEDGTLSQYQAIVEDITEARLAEDLMRDYQVELAAQVEQRTRELEVANRSLERRAEEIAAITGVAQALASATDPVPVLQEVAQLLCRLLDARDVGINVYDISAQTRMLIGWHPPQGHARMRLGTVRPLSEYLYRVRLLGERRTISIARDANTPEAAQIRDVMIDEEVNTLIVAPMLVRSEVVGDILITTARLNSRMRESDLRLVETIAGQLAASLELGRLLSAEQRERLRAEGLHEVAKMINRSLDPAVVMSVVLSELAKVTDFDGASIWLREGDELWLAEATGQAVPYAGQRIAVGTRSAIGEVFHQRTTVAIEDTLSDEHWARWFPEYAMRSWMGAPMVAEGEVIGALCIERLAPGCRPGDALLLQALADSAAIAVVNARLYKRAQVVAAVEERERLARDLHDAVTQTIFSASILAEALPLQLHTQPERAEETVEALQLLTRGALAEMRSLLMELRPNGLSEVSLETLIKHLTDALAGKSSIQTRLSSNWQLVQLPEEVQVTFYRVAQEALNNISTHAEASEAVVELSNSDGQVQLRIEDNGRGFDLGAARPGHFGLQIMRERAAAIGAHFDIESRPGAGTRIRLEWLAQREEAK